MKKNKPFGKKSQQNGQNPKSEEIKKSKNLFDHLTAIRTTKDSNYYESLSEQERKGFNHWAILHGLSQDVNLIELVSFLWRNGYYDKIPSPQFYKLLVDLVPQTNQRLFWTKKTRKGGNKVLNYVVSWFQISSREADEYLNIFLSSDEGLKQLCWILEGQGLTEKQIEDLLTGEGENE